jgi:hypothetical protein
VTSDDAALDRQLERLLVDRMGAAVLGIRRRPFEHSSSYPAEVVTACLSTGDELRLFLKRYGSRRQPTDSMEQRQQRESLVYRDVLPGSGLGTPELVGLLRDGADRCTGLVLELVPGVPVKWCGFEQWVSAARWLGRMHGRFPGRPLHERHRFLVRYDAELFASVAQRALDAVGVSCRTSQGRVAKAVDRFLARTPPLDASETTLVHGGYRPQNILWADGASPRIAPVDWEEAGIGPPFYDFAYLADGFEPRRRAILFAAYRRGAAEEGASLPSGGEAWALVDWFSLAKTFGTLGKAAARRFPPGAVLELVGMAESTAARLAP